MTPWMEDLDFTVTVACQTLSKYYPDVTWTTSELLTSQSILNPVRKLRSFRKWEKGMDINPEDETSYTAQYQEAILKNLANDRSATHRRIPVIQPENVPPSNIFLTPMASGFGHSSFDPYDLSSDDKEYLTPERVAEKTPRRSDCTACLLTAASMYLNSPPESPMM